VLALWQLISGRVIPAYEISDPRHVFTGVVDILTSRSGWVDIRVTAVEVLSSFVIGAVAGTVLGLALGASRPAGRVLEPLIAAVNGIPKIALAPLFVLLLGIGLWSKIAIGALSVMFILFYNVYMGTRTIRHELVQTMLIMGARKRHVLGYVTLPSLAAPFFAGLKAAGPLAIVTVIAGEFVASFDGIGHELYVDSNNLDAVGVLAEIVVLVLMSLVLNGFLSLLDRVVVRRLGEQEGRS
jgi:NitT/TauT family transport system permease protein